MRQTLLVLATIAASLLLMTGLVLLLFYALIPLTAGTRDGFTREELITTGAQVAVFGSACLIVGALLLNGALRAFRNRDSSVFRPPVIWAVVAVVAFLLALFVGARALQLRGNAASYAFPWFALIAVIAPPVVAFSLLSGAILARGRMALAPAPGGLGGRTSREDPFAANLIRSVAGPPTWRRMFGSLAWGMGGATIIATVLELIGAAVILLIGVLLVGGTENLSQMFSSVNGAGDCTTQQHLFSNPAVVGLMLFSLSVGAPIIEEPAKSLAVVFLRRRVVAPLDAFLYGAAAGAGFGIFESTFYNVASLSDWWATATLRAGTTLIHALATGLFGLAWYSLFTNQGKGRFFRFALVSVFVHGLWNAISVAVLVVGAQRGCAGDAFELVRQGDGAGYVAVAVFALVALGAGAILFGLSRYLSRSETAINSGS